jgi:hypothetical protein
LVRSARLPTINHRYKGVSTVTRGSRFIDASRLRRVRAPALLTATYLNECDSFFGKQFKFSFDLFKTTRLAPRLPC